MSRIPRKIHYCWFGNGKKSAKMEQCIKSWKKYCPSYELIEWNERNIDIHENPYMEKCYNEKKYAFLADYVRLVVLEKHGGIYMDTDVELLKPLDGLLDHEAYIGFETNEFVNTGMGIGSIAHGNMIRAMLKEYELLLDGRHDIIGCPILNTQALVKLGMKQDGTLQRLPDCTVYPIEWFNPYDDPTGRLKVTENTVSIHWYAKSWMSKRVVIRSYLSKPLHRLKHWMKKTANRGQELK